MILRALHRAATPAGWALGIITAVLLLLGVGKLVPDRPGVAGMVAVAVLAFGLTLAEPAVIPLLAMPALLVIARVKGGGIDLSFSDVALFAAFLPAVVLGKRPFSTPLRTLLWLTAIYQVSTLFAVVANPYSANVIEWFHAGLLVGGALIVGWAIGREGHARIGLSLLLLTACALAAITIAQGLKQAAGGNFGPVYPNWPYPMHKNFAGTVLGILAIVAYTHPSWMGWSRRWALSAFWLCAAGLLFTQSRQALVGLSIALIVLVLRNDATRRRSKLIILMLVPALVLVATLVRDQLQSGNQFNSAFQRLSWFSESLDIWNTSPLFGVGLRWWYTNRFPVKFQPPNGEMEVLTSGGLVGLAGFVVLLGGALIVLWRIDPLYGTMAFCAVLSRVVQSQLDFFWVAAQVSLPFVIAGICLGAQGAQHEVGPLGAEPLSRDDDVDHQSTALTSAHRWAS